jgi:hypothetical protein
LSEHKSLTELAMRKKREAYQERRDKPGAPLAPGLEREATELLKLDHPTVVGTGGEVVVPRLSGFRAIRRSL